MISVQASSGSRVMIAATLMLALPFAALAGPTPADKCEASKNKTAGAYYSCLEKAEATAITKGLAMPDYSKCTAKFDSSWDKAETTGAEQCPDNVLTAPMNAFLATQAAEAAAVIAGAPIPDCQGDLSTCEEDLTTCDGDLAACQASSGLPATGQTTAYGTGSDGDVQAGAARSFTDNGDGTITDNVTGLMWEKKDDSNLGGAAGIHDKDNSYQWSNGSPSYLNMNGSIVTVFLATLNDGAGFAGHTDWRVPNLTELESLRNLEAASPSTYPAFNTGCAATCTVTSCSCTSSSYQWSSSTWQSSSGNAWAVYYVDWDLFSTHKGNAFPVRAVRRAGS